MTDWFSEEELDRMARFASSPAYSRSPNMLLPEEEEDQDESDETPSSTHAESRDEDR